MKRKNLELERETNRLTEIVGIFKMLISGSNRSSGFKINVVDNV